MKNNMPRKHKVRKWKGYAVIHKSELDLYGIYFIKSEAKNSLWKFVRPKDFEIIKVLITPLKPRDKKGRNYKGK